MPDDVRKVVIVGGGTAGWLTAGIVAAHLKQNSNETVSITLIESSNIPPVGVGEGTWPTMRTTLSKIGVRETDFIKECNATFKQGAKFAKWTTGKDDDFYYHPLVLPEGYNDINLVPHWPNLASQNSFSNAVCAQERICELGLAPKSITTPEYKAVANYSYHLDAGKFSTFLTKHCVANLGVKHIIDDVLQINNDQDGYISNVDTAQHGQIEGDLFVDCTGFKSLLLGEHFNVPFKCCKDILFNDTAIAVHVPYASDDAPIASHTISTATSAGWIWDIGLSNRKGVGHVFSSAHISEEQALLELQEYVRGTGAGPASLSYRKIPFNPGHREKFWHKNCVAIGLSAGFLEPLEASALVLVEISAMFLAEQLPVNRLVMKTIEKRFNQTFLYRWDRIIDFLKLHYVLTQRTDSQYWRDNTDPKGIPESLKELLELWRFQYPWHDDFDRAVEVFPSASYQYVLYGMGFKTSPSHVGQSQTQIAKAQDYFYRNQKMAHEFTNHLPSHRELINKVHQYGFQKV